MHILPLGAQLARGAQQRLDAAAQRLAGAAQSPQDIDPGDLVDLQAAKNEGALAAKLLRTGQAMSDALLDAIA